VIANTSHLIFIEFQLTIISYMVRLYI
jgi:hypothetical protein